MASTMTVQDLRDALAKLPAWLEVTVVDDMDYHRNVTRVRIAEDNEGEQVAAIEYED